MDKEILEILKRLEEGQIKTNEKLEKIEKKLDGVVEQTANLTEFRTEVMGKLEDLKEVEEVTKVNCYEIAKIKAVK